MSPVCVLLMFVCLQRGQVSTAVPEVQILNLKVEYGESASLPCNGSAYLGEKGIVTWETSMGKKVAILQFLEEKEWEKFELQSEVLLPTDEQLHAGDWSLVFQPAMLRDSGTYQCIWEGQRQAIMSTVWLTVNEPHIEDDLLCFEGETVTLKCYLPLSRSQIPSSLQVGWTKDGQTLESTGEERTYPADDAHRFQISIISMEEYHLKISPTRLGDNGAYHCWYKTRDSESPRPGLPSIFHLSVLESTFKATVYTETHTRWTYRTIIVTEDDATETVTPSSDLKANILDVHAQPAKEAQTMAALQETVMSHQDEVTTSKSLPWVRIGLIAGVLLVTAVVLCVLKARQKI